MNDTLAQKCYGVLNRVTKWRNVFAGWQLGTRTDTDPECKAVKDHREVTILLRIEGSAMLKLLVDKGIFTEEEFQRGLIEEAELLDKDYERRFPGVQATDIGIKFDRRAAETMKDWLP